VTQVLPITVILNEEMEIWNLQTVKLEMIMIEIMVTAVIHHVKLKLDGNEIQIVPVIAISNKEMEI